MTAYPGLAQDAL